ncbi:hypothetical protein J8269_02660 [Campylobacter jejuni]|nr:hypothetical protein [Campylobacter jejuni]
MKHCLALCFIFFLCACSVKNQNFSSQSLMVLIASPMIKINDAAFLKKENNALNLEVHKLWQKFLYPVNDKNAIHLYKLSLKLDLQSKIPVKKISNSILQF